MAGLFDGGGWDEFMTGDAWDVQKNPKGMFLGQTLMNAADLVKEYGDRKANNMMKVYAGVESTPQKERKGILSSIAQYKQALDLQKRSDAADEYWNKLMKDSTLEQQNLIRSLYGAQKDLEKTRNMGIFQYGQQGRDL